MKYQAKVEKQLCNASICTKDKIKKLKKVVNNYVPLDQITLFSKVTGDKTRGRIIFLLYKYKALCVCDISNVLDISVASASQHLRKMKDLGLVSTKKDGTTIFYAISSKEFITYLSLLYKK